VTSQLPTRRC